MKNFAWILVAFVVTTGYYSCTKDKAAQPVSANCVGIDSNNTYNLRIKTIIDGNCAYVGCHDGTYASGGVVMQDYTGTKSAFTNKNALCTIKQDGNCLAMPQGSDKLADSLITYIQCWSENGYAQ